MTRWTLLFAALTAALTVGLFLVVRQNGDLRRNLEVLAAAKGRANGFDLGQRLAPVRLEDAAGESVTVRFDEGALGTLVLVHASSCDACAATAPRWGQAIAAADRPDVRVLCLRTDADGSDPGTLAGLPPSLAIPLPPSGWPAALPAVPATLLLDHEGRLVWSAFGELSENDSDALSGAIRAVGMSGAARDG